MRRRATDANSNTTGFPTAGLLLILAALIGAFVVTLMNRGEAGAKPAAGTMPSATAPPFVDNAAGVPDQMKTFDLRFGQPPLALP